MWKTATPLRSPLLLALALTCLVSLSVIWVRSLGILEYLELSAYDWAVRLQPHLNTPYPAIVLVTISEKDLQQLGRWPLSDDTLAQLLETLVHAHPRAVGLDIYRNFPVPPGYGKLKEVLATYPEIIAVMKFPGRTGDGIPGPPGIQDPNRLGFNDILPDPGGIVRRGLLFLHDGETAQVSFSLRLAFRYLASQGIQPQPDPDQPEILKLGTTTIPPFSSHDGGYVEADDRGYQVVLRYYPAVPAFSEVPFGAILSGKISPRVFEGKIVLVGSTAESVKDNFYTPYSVGLAQDQQIPGIELHAHLVAQFLRMGLNGEKPIQTWPEAGEVGWIIVWCLLGGAIGLWIRAVRPFIIVVGGGMIALGLGAWWALGQGWWIPIIPPALGLVMTGGLVTVSMRRRERYEKSLLMDIFSRHVSKEVAEEIWQERDQFLQDGRLPSRKQTVTVLFADLQNFTGRAEKMFPQDLMEWLNGFMEVIGGKIMEYGGVVDDYFGDGIKADFGIPFPRTREEDIRQDAQHAVQCALAIKQEIARLNREAQAQGFPDAVLRVGIYTGTVVVGSLGSSRRLKYTTIGDAVNVAARLESWEKDTWEAKMGKDVCRILIGQTTKDYLNNLKNRWMTEEVGMVQLKGRVHPIKVYRVVG